MALKRKQSTFSASPQQMAIWDVFRKTDAHVVINALAGTGKTTTIIKGLSRLTRRYKNVCFMAFNKSIAKELAGKVPAGVRASTIHSYGNSICYHHFQHTLEEDKVWRLIQELWEAKTGRDNPPFIIRKTTQTLVGHCKSFLMDGREEELLKLIEHFDLESEGPIYPEVFQLVPEVLRLCFEETNTIDWDDMVWLPLVHELPLPKFDMLLIDEAQDLNRARQELILRSADRVCIVGDTNQAIYGFTGADTESMPNMTHYLKERNDHEVINLPLTITYRCPKLHVKLAQTLVPDLQHAPDAIQGSVFLIDTLPESQLKYGDMVICRINAPLVSACYRLIRNGIRANMVGRNIGVGLVSLVKRLKQTSIEGLLRELDKWHDRERRRILSRKRPSGNALINLQDRRDCLAALCENQDSVASLVQTIQTMFEDIDASGHNKNCVRFSSIHRVKGLEAERVFIVQPELIPHYLAKSDWEKSQERNIGYVAVTRSKNELYFVGGMSTLFAATIEEFLLNNECKRVYHEA